MINFYYIKDGSVILIYIGCQKDFRSASACDLSRLEFDLISKTGKYTVRKKFNAHA